MRMHVAEIGVFGLTSHFSSESTCMVPPQHRVPLHVVGCHGARPRWRAGSLPCVSLTRRRAGSHRSPAARCCKTCVRWPAPKTQPRGRAGAARGRGRARQRWDAAPAVLGSTLALAGSLVTQPAGKTHRSQVMRYIKHIVSVSSRLVNALC